MASVTRPRWQHFSSGGFGALYASVGVEPNVQFVVGDETQRLTVDREQRSTWPWHTLGCGSE